MPICDLSRGSAVIDQSVWTSGGVINHTPFFADSIGLLVLTTASVNVHSSAAYSHIVSQQLLHPDWHQDCLSYLKVVHAPSNVIVSPQCMCQGAHGTSQAVRSLMSQVSSPDVPDAAEEHLCVIDGLKIIS